jgi:hypothetical protein
LGIKYQGFAFDYAYHPLGELAEDATHFFSISYVGEDNETVVSVTEPTKESTSHVIALKHFIDVPDGYWAKDAIEYSATANIVNGYPDGTFRPDSPISRAELSAILVRVKDLKLAEALSQSVFKDVKPSHWAAKYVWAAKYENFITGYPNQTFKPANKITRAEGTSLFARFEKLQLPDYIVERPFPDIATRHWAAKEIQAAGSFGFLKYLEGMYFRPNRPMSRAEAVAMLTKTTVGKAKIDDFFKYNVTIVEGPYPFKDFYVASNPTDTNTTKTKQKTLTKVTKETATKTSTKAKESSSSLTQQQYAQARLERLKKIKVYLKESRGVYITGKTTMPNESGKAMQVYILSDGNFMLIQDSGTKVSAVSIYNPKTGKWTNLSIDAVASVNQ